MLPQKLQIEYFCWATQAFGVILLVDTNKDTQPHSFIVDVRK